MRWYIQDKVQGTSRVHGSMHSVTQGTKVTDKRAAGEGTKMILDAGILVVVRAKQGCDKMRQM